MRDNLIEGVNTFGRRSWDKILRSYTFPIGMTPTALRGKWEYLCYKQHMVRWRRNKWILQLTDDSTNDEGMCSSS